MNVSTLENESDILALKDELAGREQEESKLEKYDPSILELAESKRVLDEAMRPKNPRKEAFLKSRDFTFNVTKHDDKTTHEHIKNEFIHHMDPLESDNAFIARMHREEPTKLYVSEEILDIIGRSGKGRIGMTSREELENLVRTGNLRQADYDKIIDLLAPFYIRCHKAFWKRLGGYCKSSEKADIIEAYLIGNNLGTPMQSERWNDHDYAVKSHARALWAERKPIADVPQAHARAWWAERNHIADVPQAQDETQIIVPQESEAQDVQGVRPHIEIGGSNKKRRIVSIKNIITSGVRKKNTKRKSTQGGTRKIKGKRTRRGRSNLRR